MFALTLLLVGLCGYVSSDVPSVVDQLLKHTLAEYPSALPFENLNYAYQKWKGSDLVLVGDFNATNGQVMFNNFRREQAPSVWGSSTSGILETKFLIDLDVSYGNYVAFDAIGKKKTSGQMTLNFKGIEMFSWIGLEKQGDKCETTVKTYTPIYMPHGTPDFGHGSVELAKRLYDEAKYSLEYSLNETMVDFGWPKFEKASQGMNLCVVLEKK